MNPASPKKPKSTGLQPLRDATILLLLVLLAGSVRVTWAPEAATEEADAREIHSVTRDQAVVEPDLGAPVPAMRAFTPPGDVSSPETAPRSMTPARLQLRVSCTSADVS